MDKDRALAQAELADWLARDPGEAGEKAITSALEAFEAFTSQVALDLAPDWETLPEAVRHGIIRLAAHHCRSAEELGPVPPAAVAALWRPWRRMAQYTPTSLAQPPEPKS